MWDPGVMDRVMGLNVVRHLGAVLRRRGLLLFTWAPGAEGDARSSEMKRTVCPAAGNGRRGCDNHDAAIAQCLELRRPWQVSSCPAGARELVAPVALDGQAVGAFVLGGEAFGATSEEETDLLGDLMAGVASEVSTFVRSLTQRAPSGLRHRYDAIVGGAPAMQAMYSLLDRVSRSESTVLIQGENGTGKELVARAIHNGSTRRERPFVITNCSAFNDNLLDSELFGHKRGAFTGAVADKPGLFETADNGTFFLDEIGDMSPVLQVKVLRVIQEGTYSRVGDNETRRVDVRLVAATNRDLRAMVAKGQFREDLYYRINVINLVLPALRERVDDFSLLVDHFLEKHRRAGGGRLKRLSDECMARVSSYRWPGNVRELENEIERLIVLSGDDAVIGEELLSPRIRYGAQSEEPRGKPGSLPDAVESLERRMILEALRRHRGNKSKAAIELHVSRRNLIRLVQKYRLEK